MGSEPSSSDSLDELCECGHQRRRHLEPPGGQCVACPGDEERTWRHEFTPKKPELRPRCTCGHFRTNHNGGKAACIILRCECQTYVCDHSGCGWKPRGEEPKPCTCGPDEACGDSCKYEPRCEGCGHTKGEGCGCPPPHEHAYKYQTGGVFKCACGAVALLTEPGAEPPLTPEEEEQAPEDEALAQFEQDVLDGKAGGPLPPQPEQRPPYAVAYSVQGHLYEVALSGDATVRAVDGALVIQHSLGPIAGIVQTRPVINEES
jgi:hypothetical protein